MRPTSSRSSRTHTTTAITTPLEPPCCLSAAARDTHGRRDGGGWGWGVSGDRSGCKVWAVKRSRRQDREEWPRLGIWEWTSGQVDEQVGGEEKEQGVGYEVSLIFGMQWLKKWTQKKKRQTNGAWILTGVSRCLTGARKQHSTYSPYTYTCIIGLLRTWTNDIARNWSSFSIIVFLLAQTDLRHPFQMQQTPAEKLKPALWLLQRCFSGPTSSASAKADYKEDVFSR